jgi:competence protein ComEA
MQMNSQAPWHRSTVGLALGAMAAVVFAVSVQAAEGSATPTQPPSAQSVAPAKKKTSAVPSSQQVDINSADRERLKTLPGIGNAEAEKIIAGRPYHSKTDLVLRNVLPESSYAAIKYRIVAVPPGKPSSKK